jgi:hypothetical protein
VRLTTAFNRLLQLSAASVESVASNDRGVVIGLRRRRRQMLCLLVLPNDAGAIREHPGGGGTSTSGPARSALRPQPPHRLPRLRTRVHRTGIAQRSIYAGIADDEVHGWLTESQALAEEAGSEEDQMQATVGFAPAGLTARRP